MSVVDESAPLANEAALRAVAAATDQESAVVSYWQRRILVSTIVGYALYYFVRKNITVAMPAMEADGLSKVTLGTFLTLHGLLYGVSKFTNGIIGDRVNARWLMPTGLLICGVINVFLGFTATVFAFGLLWAINGWFQGLGYPPCARLMTHWFSPEVFATKMGMWNTSHTIGTGVVAVLCGYLVLYDWRLCFFVPGLIAITGALWLALTLRDTPESLGLPPVEGTTNLQHDTEPVISSLQRLVFANSHIWLLSIANFFVYAVRYGLLDWAPTFLKQARGIDITHGSWFVAGYEAFGLFGMLLGGWITDRVFGGRAARACFFYMILCTCSLLLFWLLPNQSWFTSFLLLCTAGFFIYGPQSLIGTAAANLATKRAAAAAVGLTGLFGYASTTLSGVGIGALADGLGWDAAFLVFFACGLFGTLLFACCWQARPHGYHEEAATV
jgi:OPA family glycerol-3-phosphate transporter-like MFS transporter/OPA family sugar phosphate sensor protein UhpC-like MFS transporter